MVQPRLYLSTLLLHVALTNAVCDDKCQPIADLLSKCSLPPLSTDPASVGKPKTRPQEGTTFGPASYFIDSIDTARCFCSTARDSFKACTACFDEGDATNEGKITELYQGDCLEFGYFVNQTLSYPSTTRDALPSSTATSSDANCPERDTCGVVRDQVAECGLTSFDDVAAIPSVDYFLDKLADKMVPSRKAAECLCTKPVLNRLNACGDCIGQATIPKFSGNLTVNFAVAKEYHSQCTRFGYYADAPLDSPGPSGSGSGSSSKTSGGAGAAPTGKPEEDAAPRLLTGEIVALLAAGTAMSMFWSLI